MGNPLLLWWHRMVEARDDDAQPEPTTATGPELPDSSGAIFLVLRRMRVPLIVLVVVFSISVLGLTLIPGEQPDGGTEPMTFFDAFYFMSYTATTIGFGEIPYALTTEQRMWVTLSIFVAVVGWAYAIGTLLALLQDRGFRRELATQRFARQVRRMPEPFLIVLGYGEAGARVVAGLDRHGRRIVVLDRSQERIDALDLAALHADVPALAANGRQPTALQLAGLTHPRCVGVLALTDDDEANLATVQAVHLLRPGLPVIARAAGPATGERMRALGDPTVVDPFDAFGDRLRLILRSPVLAQLFEWLVSPPGAGLPPLVSPPAQGRWVVIGHSRTVSEVVADLHAADLGVSVFDPDAVGRRGAGAGEVLAQDALAGSVALLAAADRDTINVDAVAAARRLRPGTFVVARQESPANAALFAALRPDLLLVPAEVVAREVLERLANPALWEFLTAAREQDEAWAARVRDRLVATSGPGSPSVWQVRLDDVHAPALVRRMRAGGPAVRLGDLLLSPFGRDEHLALTVLMLVRGGSTTLLPGDDVHLDLGDLLLLAGGHGAQRGWDATLGDDDALAYVLSGRGMATSWWGRRLLPGRR